MIKKYFENFDEFLKGKSLVMIFIAFSVTLLFALNGKYISSGYKIAVGQVSNVQLKANRDVENTVKYEKDKQEVIDTTEPRYTIDQNITNSVLDSIDDFFIIADEERQSYKNYQATKTPEQPAYTPKKLNTLLSSSDEVNTILSADDSTYNAFKLGTINLFKTTLEAGVKESDLEKNKVYVEEQFKNLTPNQALNQVGIDIYETFFRANLVVDNQATDQAINDKLSEVEPEIYLKGQTIVNDGDIVTEEQYQMLKSLGYVDTTLAEKSGQILGVTLFLIAVFFVSYLFLKKFYRTRGRLKNKEEKFLLSVYIVSVTFVWATSSFPVYLSPILISVAIISIFLGYSFALFYTLVITAVSALICGFDLQYLLFILLSNLFISVIAKFILDRRNLYKVALSYGLFNVIVFFSIYAIFSNTIDVQVLLPLVFIFMQALVTVIITFGIIPICEMAFSMLTTNKLLELSNPENELIKKCIVEIPGTYHHSLVVANLCDVAANAIGANSAFVRVCAYYHDIGKLVSPLYFSENQTSVNIHDNISPFESYELITSHIDYGIFLAKKHKLPEEIINMIPEHHGTTLVKYFYVKAKNANPDSDEVKEELFRYKGPLPQSKEAGILMFADSCEAAVRSIVNKVADFSEIEIFVDKLMNDKINDGQLAESGLTFGDVKKIKEAFMSVFTGMYHQRVEYPKLKSEETEETKEIIEETQNKEKAE